MNTVVGDVAVTPLHARSVLAVLTHARPTQLRTSTLTLTHADADADVNVNVNESLEANLSTTSN